MRNTVLAISESFNGEDEVGCKTQSYTAGHFVIVPA